MKLLLLVLIINFLSFGQIDKKKQMFFEDDSDLWIMPITGNPSSPGSPTNAVIVFSATEDLDVTVTDDVVLVSVVKAADNIYRSHTVTISCPNGGSGRIIVNGSSKIVSLGNHRGASDPNVDYYVGNNLTAPHLDWNLNDIPKNTQKIRQLTGVNGVTSGNQAFPSGLTFLHFASNSHNWTYNGALPSGLTSLWIGGTNIVWTYNGALPSGLTYLRVDGININWTYNKIGNASTPKPNMTFLQITNYRNPSDNMDYADLLVLLQSLLDDVGNLPSTVVIREQIAGNVTAIAAATPDEFGTDPEKAKYLINLIKSSKSVTTFTLNTTNI